MNCAAFFSSTLTNPRASSCLAHSSTVPDNQVSDAPGLWRAAHLMTVFVLGLTSVMERGSACEQASNRPRKVTNPNLVNAFDMALPVGFVVQFELYWRKMIAIRAPKLCGQTDPPVYRIV